MLKFDANAQARSLSARINGKCCPCRHGWPPPLKNCYLSCAGGRPLSLSLSLSLGLYIYVRKPKPRFQKPKPKLPKPKPRSNPPAAPSCTTRGAGSKPAAGACFLLYVWFSPQCLSQGRHFAGVEARAGRIPALLFPAQGGGSGDLTPPGARAGGPGAMRN